MMDDMDDEVQGAEITIFPPDNVGDYSDVITVILEMNNCFCSGNFWLIACIIIIRKPSGVLKIGLEEDSDSN